MLVREASQLVEGVRGYEAAIEKREVAWEIFGRGARARSLDELQHLYAHNQQPTLFSHSFQVNHHYTLFGVLKNGITTQFLVKHQHSQAIAAP